MKAIGMGLAVFIGMLLPLQALINAALGRQTFGPLFAALMSFAVGTGVLALWWLVTRPSFDFAALARVPWWAWTGGAIGAIYVAAATLLIPRMGAAPLICLVVFGQLIGSLLLDHFGVLHARQPIDATRVIGALLVIAGALLVVRPWQTPAG
ncbi:DMT family transporter [Pseudoxanthomonas beigongshangi]